MCSSRRPIPGSGQAMAAETRTLGEAARYGVRPRLSTVIIHIFIWFEQYGFCIVELYGFLLMLVVGLLHQIWLRCCLPPDLSATPIPALTGAPELSWRSGTSTWRRAFFCELGDVDHPSKYFLGLLIYRSFVILYVAHFHCRNHK